MPLELSDIVDPSYLQAMLETFSDDMRTTGIQVASAILNEEARPMVYEVNHCKFCNKVRETTAGEHQCYLSDRRAIEFAKQCFKNNSRTPKAVFHICNLGLLDFCAPIVINGDIIGYFFGGQLKVEYGFKYDDKLLKTSDSPILKDLLDDLKQKMEYNKVDEYTKALAKEFDRIKVLQATYFDQLKQAVDTMTQQLNSIVGLLHKSQRVEAVDAFMKDAKDVRNVYELFELVVNNLPRIMNAKDCSIFTVQKGSDENEDCLVLRKTSYRNLKPEENSAYYKRDEKGKQLTAWVWANAKPLLLKDITNPAEVGPYGIAWSKGKYNDSDEHKGFLAVPIMGHRNHQVIGVIRMPHKVIEKGREIGFTNHDAIFLNFLAHHLSRVIECQELEDQFQRSKGLVYAANELARASSRKKVIELAAKHAMSLFGGGLGKKYFVNCHSPGSQKWTIEKVEGDLELISDFESRKFNISDGLTGKVIRKEEPILLYDLKEAEDDGIYIAATCGGKSAMAAPMKHGDKIYGIIGVVSDKKFSFSEKDRQILAILAEISADAIVGTRWFWLRELLKRIMDFLPLATYLPKRGD